jgi:outer membrane protein insertion porin family
VRDEALRAQVLFDSGEVFNKRKYELIKYQITSLYREEGYLFVELNDRLEFQDTLVEVTFSIRENSLAHINRVDVRGNTKTKDKVIRREIKLFPGDVYRQSLLMRSQRDIMQLAFFDNVEPDIERETSGDGSDVNLIFKVTEKEAGTGTFSAGAAYSGRDGMVGTLGLQIPNFMGNGQRAAAIAEVYHRGSVSGGGGPVCGGCDGRRCHGRGSGGRGGCHRGSGATTDVHKPEEVLLE